MAGADKRSQTDPGGPQRRANHSRIARYTVIVLDASIVVELVTNGPLSALLRRNLAERSDAFIVPHLLDLEVASALRKLAAGGRIDSHRTAQCLSHLAALPVERYPHTPLLPRIWQLSHDFTV